MRITGAIIAAVVSAALLPSSAAAQSDAGIHFFAEPSGAAKAAGYFHLEADPGDSLQQQLALRNDSDEKLTLHLYPTDSSTAVQGGADYSMPEDELSGVGTWIVLEEDVVKLRPGQSTVVTFRVRVPEDAPTGENLGGIAIYPQDESEIQEVDVEGNEAGAQVIVEYRRVIAVQVDLPGDSEPQLVISGIRPSARPSGAFLDMDIANEGHGLTKGVGILRVPEFDFQRKFQLDTFVPRSQIFYPMSFRNKISVGEYEASIRIEYDEGDKVAEWAGTFVIEPELQEQLAERGAPGAVALGSSRGNLVPVGIAVGVAALLVFAYRRRRDRKDDAGPGPEIVVPATTGTTETPLEEPAALVDPALDGTEPPEIEAPAAAGVSATVATPGTGASQVDVTTEPGTRGSAPANPPDGVPEVERSQGRTAPRVRVEQAPAPARPGSVEFIARAPEPIATTPTPATKKVAKPKVAEEATAKKTPAKKTNKKRTSDGTAAKRPAATEKTAMKKTKKSAASKKTSKAAGSKKTSKAAGSKKTSKAAASKKTSNNATAKSRKVTSSKAVKKTSTKDAAVKPARKTSSAKAPVTKKRSSARTNGSERAASKPAARTNGSARSARTTTKTKDPAKGKDSAPRFQGKAAAPKPPRKRS